MNTKYSFMTTVDLLFKGLIYLVVFRSFGWSEIMPAIIG